MSKRHDAKRARARLKRQERLRERRNARSEVHSVPLMSPAQRRRYRIAAGLWGAALVFFWSWWLDPAHFIGWGGFLLVTVPLLWLSALQLYFVLVLFRARRPASPDPVPGRWRVAMIVTKTPSEPFDVVRRTLEAMLAQDYPHDTWLADEDPSPETAAWCAAHGVRISCRKGREDYHRPVWPRRTRCKEGNLAFFHDHWGYRDYDIVSQLDADHVPQPGYLREILRPFADPAVGYVSAPSICSANARESWAARTRLHAEAAFHGALQTGYSGVLTPMCIGSHYAVRTRALKEIGGLGPELAEDHSTSMLMAAGGWRGVHAVDAIAFGDGPANVADLATQEFQWSRSLLTLLLSHTPRYLGRLPGRLRFLFVLCQLWYPLFALVMLMMYVAPALALLLDIRFADVTYPGFILHSAPAVLALTGLAWLLRRDGFNRPVEAPVISWEKALFPALQWPWVLWGCTMAVRDRLTGRFVDFRITPKGSAASRRIPPKITAIYVALAAGCVVPVFLAEELGQARGFLLLALVNAVLYGGLVLVMVWHHLRQLGAYWREQLGDLALQGAAVTGLFALILLGGFTRGAESLTALAFGLEPLQITRVEYVVSGAGSGIQPRMHFRFAPAWKSSPLLGG
ncbi:glycosyltransferase [Cereibacter azotoformans]|uniref:Cellulose synthase (UDP-forming) n=1 Tax=Cereibacter azotoformans TaxID=43057 RepID=A0A2T5JTQ0_9RHOB|nr:glycosyltransferase family 2 protein [Cereibacter azotoformans]AXQ93416.1 glycosyltransferase [Cereibacter sphaeroides]MBO4168828.1 glycosyltransferase [Cereibacter azotoformans]PTR13526.1 cellulose synthase (UDP-forming) [Cereibacter azotoformans]UIJ31747.1 glycosyltransferase [Cereibacter azotoformans]